MELEVKQKSGLTNYQLKIIAIIAMTVDHVASGFVPYESFLSIIMHFIGRITGPVMFYMAVEGYHRTSNLKRYILRLGIFALISYFPFMYFQAGGNLENLYFLNLNVIYTIFLGVIAVHISRTIKNIALKIFLIIVITIASSIGDWGIIGIIIMLCFDFYYGNFKNQGFCYLIIAIMGGGIIAYLSIPQSIMAMGWDNFISNLEMYKYTLSSLGMFLPIILLSKYNGEKGSNSKFSKWLFYIYYPLHLLVLGVVASLLY